MSIQISILKVLASHIDGRSSIAALNRDMAVLASTGREWSDRIKRLASAAPDVDIFGSGYVDRESEGWRITVTGRRFLQTLETGAMDAPRILAAA